jgi:hypothetical protein
MDRRELSRILFATGAGAAVLSSRASAQTSCNLPCYPANAEETGVTITNPEFAPGDVRRYGADPTGSLPSGAAINAALSATRSVYVPRGTYNLGSTALGITHANQHVYGDGAASILAWSSGYTGSGLVVSADHCQLQDLYIEKNRSNSAPAPTAIGIDNQSNTSSLFNVKVSSEGSGTALGWHTAVRVRNWVHKFSHCRFSGEHRALYSEVANYVTAANTNFSSSGDAVVYFNGGSGNSIVACDIEGDANNGVYIDDGGTANSGHGSTTILGCYIEGQPYAITIMGGEFSKDVHGISINGNFLNGNVPTCLIGILANRVNGLFIAGNNIINHSQYGISLGAGCTDVCLISNHLSSVTAGWAPSSVANAVSGLLSSTPGRMTLATSRLSMPKLPTSPTGLTSGQLWNDAGTLKIV